MKLRTTRDLRELRARIASLPAVRARIAKRAAEEFSKMSKESFDAQQTPEGEPWKPGKGGRVPTLKKSGDLEKKATTYTASGSRVRAEALTLRYARYQLRRGFIPRKLPPAWLARLREIATEEITAHLTGGR